MYYLVKKKLSERRRHALDIAKQSPLPATSDVSFTLGTDAREFNENYARLSGVPLDCFAFDISCFLSGMKCEVLVEANVAATWLGGTWPSPTRVDRAAARPPEH